MISPKNENESIQGVYLRQKFTELSQTLEEDVASLVERHLNSWRDENLPVVGANFNHINTKSAGAVSAKFISKTKSSALEGQLPSRVFVARPSLLSELLTVSHIGSIYNIFASILFLLFINEVLEEIVLTGSISFGFSSLAYAFGHFDRVIIIWLYMKVSTMIIVYLCYHFWAHHRHKAPGVYDVTASVLYVLYLISFLKLPVQSLLSHQLPPASSIIILCEQVRLFMKTWAFVRGNITRTLNYKKDDSSGADSPCPDFSQYLYFLFVPTLIYRDEYPRNKSCNWRKVTIEFGQVIGCIFYTHFLIARFCVPAFEKFGKEEFSKSKFLVAVFSSCFPGSLVFLCGFFAILHSWMNAFAEMLQFADRLFYKDWWNSTSYPRFYRTWNCIVHDWLYEYIYKELNDLQLRAGGIFQRLKFLPMLVVFLISAAVHEYILAVAFRFFYPVLLIMFGGFGMLLMFFNTKAKLFNVFLWTSLILGTGILMCLYSIEWYARINCPPVMDGMADYFVPRSWFCHSSST